MVLLKICTKNFIEPNIFTIFKYLLVYKETTLEEAFEIKNYVDSNKIAISSFGVNESNPLIIEIITDDNYIQNIKNFFANRGIYDENNIIESIKNVILNSKYIKKLKLYIELYPNYSEIIHFILSNYPNSVDFIAIYKYCDNDNIRKVTENFFEMIEIINLKISNDIKSMITSYFDIDEMIKKYFIEIYPQLFLIK